MRTKSSSEARINIDKTTHKGEEVENTASVQLKNSSQKDGMSAVDYIYKDAAGVQNKLHLSDDLQPRKKIKVDFANAGINVKVVDFYIAWQFQGIDYSSQRHAANAGSYYFSMDIGLKPDGSSETDWLIQKPI